MTLDPRFDFKAYVGRRQKAASEGDGRRGPAGYAFAADRQALEALSRLAPLRMAVEAYLRTFKDVKKADLLGSAVKVSSRQFPKLHELVTRSASALRIGIPEVYVTQNPVINAYTYGTNDDSFILIHSATVDHLDEQELLFVLGHECGHIQNEHVTYRSVARDLAGIGSLLVAWAFQPVSLLLDAWTRRSEVTADRAGLLVGRSPESAKRALIKIALGSAKLYEQVDMDEFLAQAGELRKTLGRYSELLQCHPYLPKRVKALELFERSTLYAGEAPGRLGPDELDDRVEALVKVLG